MNFNIHDLWLMLPEDVLLGATCAILLIDLFIKPSQRAITQKVISPGFSASKTFLLKEATSNALALCTS